MLATAAPRASPKAERFDRPVRDGLVFLLHSPALRAGLLSLSPSLLWPPAASLWRGLRIAGAP
jgi:hypothetical protein